MADNTVLNAGAGGDTYASDDIGGIKFSRVKLITGADGTNDGDVAKGNPLPVRLNGATPTTANVGASATSVTVLALNAARLRAWLYNDSTSAVNVKFGASASATSFTKRLLPNEFFAVEFYTGVIDAIWDAANGNMRVTELTA